MKLGEEFKVGEIVKFKQDYLRVVINSMCEECYFYGNVCTCPKLVLCTNVMRSDKKDIIFEKISEIERMILKLGEKDGIKEIKDIKQTS